MRRAYAKPQVSGSSQPLACAVRKRLHYGAIAGERQGDYSRQPGSVMLALR